MPTILYTVLQEVSAEKPLALPLSTLRRRAPVHPQGARCCIPSMYANPRPVAWQVDAAFLSVTQASVKVHSLVSDIWACFNPPWSPVVWISLHSIFIEKNFPVNVSYSNGCIKGIFILNIPGHRECRVQVLNAWQRILLCRQRNQNSERSTGLTKITQTSNSRVVIWTVPGEPRWVPKGQVTPGEGLFVSMALSFLWASHDF